MFTYCHARCVWGTAMVVDAANKVYFEDSGFQRFWKLEGKKNTNRK